MVQPQASPILMAYSTANLLVFGRLPGWPIVTGLMWVLGAAPKVVASAQNSLLVVASCACTSNPITASYCLLEVISNKNKISYRVIAHLEPYILAFFTFFGILTVTSLDFPSRVNLRVMASPAFKSLAFS